MQLSVEHPPYPPHTVSGNIYLYVPHPQPLKIHISDSQVKTSFERDYIFLQLFLLFLIFNTRVIE